MRTVWQPRYAAASIHANVFSTFSLRFASSAVPRSPVVSIMINPIFTPSSSARFFKSAR